MKERIALIPAYEPEPVLIDLVSQLREKGFYVVVVNDGSTAKCNGIFDKISTTATVLCHERNCGKGTALKTGLSYIAGQYAPDSIIVTLDADGQHRPDDALRCCTEAEQRKDALILGCRTFSNKIPLHNKLGNLLTRFICRFAAGLNVSDTQTGLRAFGAGLIPTLVKISGERYEYEMNMLLQCSEKGIAIAEVPIETVYLNGNQSSHFHPFRDSAMIYAKILKFIASSLVSSGVDYGLFALLSLLTASLGPVLSVTLSNIAARICSSCVNYTVNRRLVFRSRAGIAKTAAQYFTLVAVILCINTVILNILVGTFGINRFLAKIAVELFCFIISWLIQQNFIFGHKPATKKLQEGK